MPALAAVDAPPAAVAQQLAALRAALDAEPGLPARDDAHLLIGTFNIRAFGDLTAKWDSAPGDSPKRNLTDVCCLAEIVRRFDVCAIQETHGELTGMLTLLRALGPSWGVILTDAGLGDAANDERLAYVFDRQAVQPSGLAGELVIDAATFGSEAVPLRAQFAIRSRGLPLVRRNVSPCGTPSGRDESSGPSWSSPSSATSPSRGGSPITTRCTPSLR
jgi:hypothetical protein